MQKRTAKKLVVARKHPSERWMEHPGARKALKKAMGDFNKIEVAEPAVKPKRSETTAIRRAVRAFYGRGALERT